MATTPRDRLEREKKRIENLDDSDIADALLELADALDAEKARAKWFDSDGRHKDHPPRTVERYVQGLRMLAEDGVDLLDVSAEEFNAVIDGIHDDDGLAKTTLQGYQTGARKFYRYHDLGVDPDDIHVYKERSKPRHDEQDMFEQAEVEALRDACGETQNPLRNRALLELLVFTGQRIRALVTLRLKDVDTDDGYLFLNDEVEGLKGARKRGRKRPMFGARKYVRNYIEYHRSGADPDDWLFIGDPSHWKTDPDDHWAEVSVDQVFRRMAETAGVDKPVNAHNFRHFFVTELRSDPAVDNDQIRMLLGVEDDSDIFKTTYSHVEDGVFIEQVEEARGYKEAQTERSSTPEACPTCGELLKPEWRRCPSCDEVFGPEAEQIADRVENLGGVAILDILENLDPEQLDGLRTVGAVSGDAEGLAAAIAERTD